ncbi:YihY/virulence factor BrkB family protein [Ruegeria sp. 2205SS24-7]|uniref:YihY/virulence factor BrkB family protein n=1 Tax=Ruegeria discodermiae TaxID=3064389 RepID=UPI002740F933|nr:YihY/virulence factor BrkB family protein [Ruegeria sp. 2205SS24-7]MDP5216222.1 YihY/virulence factor BrkB family protein [Ruegeria sp. 2205SS24-7]
MFFRTHPDPALPARAFLTALRRFTLKSGWVMSSHVAMFAMLALFPFILFSIALAGSLSENVINDDVIALIFGAWPPDVSGPIIAELKNVLNSSGTGVLTFGGLLAVFFASNGVDAVRMAMTRAYHDYDDRPFWQTRLLCIAIVVAGAAIVIVVAAIEVVLPLYGQLVSEALTGESKDLISVERLSWIFIITMPAGGVLTFHMLLPARRHKLRQILPGVVLTLVLWAVVGWGFSIYVSQFASYSATYAGLAGAMSALIFLYLISAILILGAEFNGALMDLLAEE